MAIYRISASGAAGYRAEAIKEDGMRHVCGGFATEAEAEIWVAAHKRASEAEDRAEQRSPPPGMGDGGRASRRPA
jgi:hypothetical protein